MRRHSNWPATEYCMGKKEKGWIEKLKNARSGIVQYELLYVATKKMNYSDEVHSKNSALCGNT
jgi:hypothetical protein